MKKKTITLLSLFTIVAIALLIIAVASSPSSSGIGARNVESLSSCEMKDASGDLLFKCEGETPECSISKRFLGSLTCSGEQVYPEK